MNWAEAIVLIVIVSAIAKVVRTAIMARMPGDKQMILDRKGRRREFHQIASGPTPEETALRAEVEQLRERIKVLERIATEDRKARDLSDEIESLRR